jgi:hypothetical protein
MADPQLDVTSEQFDADACLSVSDPSMVKLPYPNMPDLRSIRKCANLVPSSVRDEVDQELGGLTRKVSNLHIGRRAMNALSLLCMTCA